MPRALLCARIGAQCSVWSPVRAGTEAWCSEQQPGVCPVCAQGVLGPAAVSQTLPSTVTGSGDPAWAKAVALAGPVLSSSSIPSTQPPLVVVRGAGPGVRPHRYLLFVLSEGDDADLGGSLVADHHEGEADNQGAGRLAVLSSLAGVCGGLWWLGSGKGRLWLLGGFGTEVRSHGSYKFLPI